MIENLFVIIAAWWVWFMLGCCVLAYIDHEDRRLFRWACACPLVGGYTLTITLWPLVAWAYLKR